MQSDAPNFSRELQIAFHGMSAQRVQDALFYTLSQLARQVQGRTECKFDPTAKIGGLWADARALQEIAEILKSKDAKNAE